MGILGKALSKTGVKVASGTVGETATSSFSRVGKKSTVGAVMSKGPAGTSTLMTKTPKDVSKPVVSGMVKKTPGMKFGETSGSKTVTQRPSFVGGAKGPSAAVPGHSSTTTFHQTMSAKPSMRAKNITTTGNHEEIVKHPLNARNAAITAGGAAAAGAAYHYKTQGMHPNVGNKMGR